MKTLLFLFCLFSAAVNEVADSRHGGEVGTSPEMCAFTSSMSGDKQDIRVKLFKIVKLN